MKEPETSIPRERVAIPTQTISISPLILSLFPLLHPHPPLHTSHLQFASITAFPNSFMFSSVASLLKIK